MRLRNIPGADEVVSNSSFVIDKPEEWKGHWNELFENNHPIHMEIGMGKGRFIMDLARQNPDINYIGVERYTSVLLRAVQKMEADPLPNIRFLCIDAAELPNYFAQEEIKRIYLNFSDPWPKDRHAKRRLTSKEFLARYKEILDKNGRIEFKTDNRSLFDFSVETVEESQEWKLDAKTYDLHNDPEMNQGNIMTEYEEKFSSKGNPINKLIASRILAFFLMVTLGISAIHPIQAKADTTDYWPAGTGVNSGSVVVMEVNTGTVMYDYNGEAKVYPASTTKIMTGLLVCENCELDETLTISADAVNNNISGGSSIGAEIGEEMTVEQCLYAMMLSSANECTYALAEYVGQKNGGGYQTFIDMMNERAAALGCTGTHFANSNGLPNDDHYTTAKDFALIAAEAYKNETFRIACGTKTYVIQPTNKHSEPIYCHNHNNMIYPYSHSSYLYDYCTGGKTGFTNSAHYTLVTFAEKDGMTFVISVMNSADPNQWTDSINLYNYCFDNFQVLNIKKNESRLNGDSEESNGLLNENSSFLTFDQDAYIILPKTAEFSDAEFNMEETDSGTIEITYTYAGKTVGTVSLVEGDNTVEMPLTETEEEVDPNLKVVKINLWIVLLVLVGIAAVGVGIYYLIRLIKNFYVIKNKLARKKKEHDRFKEIHKKRKRRRKKDRMFK